MRWDEMRCKNLALVDGEKIKKTFLKLSGMQIYDKKIISNRYEEGTWTVNSNGVLHK